MVKIMSNRIERYFLPLLLTLLTAGCSESDPVMQDIRKQGKLIVLTRNAPTSYFHDADDAPAGFEYDLSKALADSLNVDVEYKVYDNIEDILTAIADGEGHLAAAGLTRTDSREQSFVFGPGYKTVQQQVVCHRQSDLPENIDDLTELKLLVIDESSYQEMLQKIQQTTPAISWESTNDLSTEQVLEKVAQQEIDCTIADSNIISLNRRYYPELVVAFPLSEQQELAWVLPPKTGYFHTYLIKWFAQIENNSTLDIINERYYGYSDIFDYYENHVFLERIEQRLPNFQPAFEQAAQHYPFTWTSLAAQAYQESGWNAEARSPTGVRGLMMLTRNTALAMGVKDRTDPLQSIKGGAKYLYRMWQKIPEQVTNEDRMWFALAAYNIGFAHLMDARELAERLGKNKNAWNDMKEILPLLTQKQYYKTLKYGYARGSEPVRYIDRIRYYQDVLEHTLRTQ